MINLHKIDDNEDIYRSGLVTLEDLAELKSLGIKTIISLKTDTDDNQAEYRMCRDNGITYLNYPINLALPTLSNAARFAKVIHLMRFVPKPLLVHCTRGSDRTGIAVAGYKILKMAQDLEPVLEEMDALGFNDAFFCWKDFIRTLGGV